MKISKENQELKDMNVQELGTKAESLRRELFGLKLNSVTAHVKDYSRFKKLRAQIARVLTYLQMKKSA